MAAAWIFLASVPALADEAAKPQPLRYLRPGKDKFVLESEITETRGKDGRTYISLTDRGREKMTLTLRFDKNDRLIAAEAVQETAGMKQRTTATIAGKNVRLQQRNIVTEIAVSNPIVTTAPDWSDIFQLAQRYDGKQGGVQEFAGLWIHPAREPRVLQFRIERVGKDVIPVNGRDKMLDRYRIRLRSGDYLAWADADRRVYKLFPTGQPKAVVVLEGFEKTTEKLGP